MSDDETIIHGKDIQAARQARLDRITNSAWFIGAYDSPGGRFSTQKGALAKAAEDHADALIQIADAVKCDSPAWPDIVRAVKDVVEKES